MHHCGKINLAAPLTRREMLEPHMAHGFGAVALSALLADGSLAPRRRTR